MSTQLTMDMMLKMTPEEFALIVDKETKGFKSNGYASAAGSAAL